jgi:hypothetical protein
VWQKEQVLGASNDTSYLVSAYPRINDVFNYGQNKELSPFSTPLVSTISLNYTTPKLPGDGTGMKALSWGTKDWVISALLKYQSGALLSVPASNNNYFAQSLRNQNPASWGGGETTKNLVPGQPLFLVDPNSHFDPTTTLVLNPAAWTDAGPGQFGTSAGFYNNYRWQRQPAESMAFGRLFPLAKEGKVTLNVRIEFQNVFNRLFYASPSSSSGFALAGTNPTAAVNHTNAFENGQPGALSSGFGFVNSVNGGPLGGPEQPRSGQIVARLVF